VSIIVANIVGLCLAWLCCSAAVSEVFGEPSKGGRAQGRTLAVTERLKPSQAFHFAYQDYLKGRYDLALSEFQQIVADFPESSLAAEAYYYIGDCYEQQGNLKEAARALITLVKEYKESRQRPAALFKLGKIMETVGQHHKAKANWSILIKEYRGSPEAKLAARHLSRIP